MYVHSLLLILELIVLLASHLVLAWEQVYSAGLLDRSHIAPPPSDTSESSFSSVVKFENAHVT